MYFFLSISFLPDLSHLIKIVRKCNRGKIFALTTIFCTCSPYFVLDSRQELRTELKGMVESFNENIRTIKKELASRHTRERKELLTSIEKQRGRKYLSSVELSELDNPYFEPEPDEQVSPKDKLDELVFSNDTPDKAELCCDERNEEHLPRNKYQTNCWFTQLFDSQSGVILRNKFYFSGQAGFLMLYLEWYTRDLAIKLKK